MKMGVIIQARMGSSRLPGKVMKKLIDQTVLSHVISRCKYIPSIQHIIVATTDLKQDDVIVQEALDQGVLIYRGSEHDVLDRYYKAAVNYHLDIIIRITSDCPLLDPGISEQVIQHFLTSDVDYCSNMLEAGFPRGLDVEVFSFHALERAYHEGTSPHHREHVTPFIYTHPHLFTLSSYISPQDYSHYRWTLDTQEDLQLIQTIYQHLYQPGKLFTYVDCIKLMEQHPSYLYINNNVQQKKYDG